MTRNAVQIPGNASSASTFSPFTDEEQHQSLQREVNRLRAELESQQNEMEKKLQREQRLAQFDELMRASANQPLGQFANDVLSALAPEVSAAQAVLYLVQEDDREAAANEPWLEAIGGYAYPVAELQGKQIPFGQGLIGQAVKSHECYQYSDLPVKKRSRRPLASQLPLSSLLVCPLVSNNQVQGVLELAAMQPFAANNRQFVQEFAHKLAGMLHLLRSNQRTNQLLQQAQQLAANLQEQQQQLRESSLQLRELNDQLENKVAQRTRQLEAQTEYMLDSYRYARRIQRGLLPNQKLIRLHLPGCQVWYSPKDILSGDFYWFHHDTEHNKSLLAVCDCTGHGVPGAFMSVLGYSMLNYVVQTHQILQPNRLLTSVDLMMRQVLAEQSSETQTRLQDGMDCSVLLVDHEHHKLEFAGANLPLYVGRAEGVEVYKPDKQCIGGEHTGEKHFTLQTLESRPGDRYYLFSDGLIDQFGGPRDRKFGGKRLRQLIQETAAKPLDEQHQTLVQALENWRGEGEQTDDICLASLEATAKLFAGSRQQKPLSFQQAAPASIQKDRQPEMQTGAPAQAPPLEASPAEASPAEVHQG